MKKLNLLNILYIFFRLAPFILVCFFVIDSVLNSNVRGLVLLSGLLVACFIATIIGNIMPDTEGLSAASKDVTSSSSSTDFTDIYKQFDCRTLSLGDNGPISSFPLSQTVLGYILSYLSVILSSLGILTSNMHVIILLSVLVVADFAWNVAKGCNSLQHLAGALSVGIGVGVAVSSILTGFSYTDLYYIAGVNDQVVCSLPTTSQFVCVPGT